jgi:hypothetical protein
MVEGGTEGLWQKLQNSYLKKASLLDLLYFIFSKPDKNYPQR